MRVANKATPSCHCCLGIHDALTAVQQHLEPGECLFAYLDDVSSCWRALRAQAGIQLHTGKTRTWNVAGERPEDMEDLGPDVWNPQGVKILGSPVGSEAFVSAFIERRLVDEQKLWDAIPSVPDLQCAWQVLLQCAGPRSHHLLRTVPPSQSGQYAGMRRTMEVLLGTIPGDDTARDGTPHHEPSPPNGRTGFEICPEIGTSCLLGLVGGCPPNVATAPAQLVTRSHGPSPPTGQQGVWESCKLQQGRWTDVGSSTVQVGKHSNEESDRNL